VRYPGPLNVAHAWAYLPDLAKALVAVAEAREQFAAFETFGFPGHSVTGSEMLAAIARAVDRPLTRKVFPWWALMALSPFVAHWRELAELAYLWRSPHEIDGGKLRAAIGAAPETPFERAVAAALDPLSR
jgi:nucleoside-diphosphate-sugar epimerase